MKMLHIALATITLFFTTASFGTAKLELPGVPAHAAKIAKIAKSTDGPVPPLTYCYPFCKAPARGDGRITAMFAFFPWCWFCHQYPVCYRYPDKKVEDRRDCCCGGGSCATSDHNGGTHIHYHGSSDGSGGGGSGGCCGCRDCWDGCCAQPCQNLRDCLLCDRCNPGHCENQCCTSCCAAPTTDQACCDSLPCTGSCDLPSSGDVSEDSGEVYDGASGICAHIAACCLNAGTAVIHGCQAFGSCAQGITSEIGNCPEGCCDGGGCDGGGCDGGC